jgi:thiol-disulfide isomerase/thioredoxin
MSERNPPRPRGVAPAMSQGVWVLVVVLTLAVALGAWRVLRDGRFSRPSGVTVAQAAPGTGASGAEAPVTGLDGLGALGERATLLQFSSAFCAPCRATRRVLGEVADVLPGVAHVEVDAEQHLDLVRRLGVVRTPTTLVLDPDGRELTRASGAPRKHEVLAALAGVLDR